MKKSIFITSILIIVSCFLNQVFSQESITKQKTKSNNTNERTIASNQLDCIVRVKSTETGISIVFDNAIVSPRDAASGLPTGKRMHKPVSFIVSLNDNSIAEVSSSSNRVSSQSSVSTKSTNTTPDSSKTTGGPIGGIIVKGGKNPGGQMAVFEKIVITDGEFSLPVELEDGDYEMSISFTYQKIEMGTADAKSSKSYVSGRFILDIDGGVCRSIKEKGVSVKSAR